MERALLSPLLYLIGFAALLHGVARLCLAGTARAWAPLYAASAAALVGYAVHQVGSGSAARRSAGVHAAVTVSLSLLLWIPSMLDLRAFRAGGRVVSTFTHRAPASWRVAAWGVILWLAFPLRHGISDIRRAGSPEMVASSAFALAAVTSFGAAVVLTVMIHTTRLRPSALLERGVWLEGGSSGRWLNSAQMQLVPWDGVVSYEWRSEDPATLEIKTTDWTGSQRLYFLRVAAENKLPIDEALRRLAGRRIAGSSD